MLPSHARQEMDGNIIVLKTNRRRLILDVPRCRLDVAHQQGGRLLFCVCLSQLSLQLRESLELWHDLHPEK